MIGQVVDLRWGKHFLSRQEAGRGAAGHAVFSRSGSSIAVFEIVSILPRQPLLQFPQEAEAMLTVDLRRKGFDTGYRKSAFA
jgi:hypothetical protein